MATMLYQGHGSYRFALDDGTVVYVDPFAGKGYDLPADLILVTHEHFDHTKVDKMPHAQGCVGYRAKHASKPEDRRQLMKSGYIIAIIAIAAVLIYFIITYVAPGAPAWLIFIVAALGIVITGAVMNKDKGK